ncbi:STAS domain-containing protein [Spirochaetota bacterium]
MKIIQDKIDNIIIILLEGSLDINTSLEVENSMDEIMGKEPNYHFLINLEKIEYMSSSGFRAIFSLKEKLDEKNRILKLSNLSKAVKAIFKILEVDDILQIYETQEEALESFKNI